MSGTSEEQERRRRSMPHYLATTDPSGQPKEPLGVLLLHGFTSSLDTISPLVPMLERQQLPYRMPILRGHNSRPEDLEGVTWHDWYADADAAMRELLAETERVAIVGLSMGGLIALDLAIKYSGRLAGVATLVVALRFKSPLTPIAGLVSRFVRYFPSPSGFSDRELAKRSTNYKRYPTKAALSLIEYQKVIEQKLAQVRVPLLVIGARHDSVVKPDSSAAVYAQASTPAEKKQLVWFERSDHEVLMDVEAQAVVGTVESWLGGL